MCFSKRKSIMNNNQVNHQIDQQVTPGTRLTGSLSRLPPIARRNRTINMTNNIDQSIVRNLFDNELQFRQAA